MYCRRHAHLLRDLGDELRRQLSQNYSVLSLIEQQAAAFGLGAADVALDGFDADRDLLQPLSHRGTEQPRL
jgi:hypothetical protein